MATRRAALVELALGLGVLACRGASAQPAEGAAYVGVETSATTSLSRARFFATSGSETGSTALDFRAHGLTRAGRRLIVFPRRPGTRFAIVDLHTLEIQAVIEAPSNRHFYGHGATTADGTRVVVTENDLETLGGSLGIYALAPPYRRLDHLLLPGPGPHEIVREGNSDRFVIALGGLETHPDYGRTPLNLGRFRSQLVEVDISRGTVDPMGYWPGTEGVSLRHLAFDGAGRLYVGGQHPDQTGGGAVLWLQEGDRVQPLDTRGLLGGYVSSVAAHGPTAIATSKETGRAVTISADRVLHVTERVGASAAAIGTDIQALSGHRLLSLGEEEVSPSPDHEFDNHGFALG